MTVFQSEAVQIVAFILGLAVFFWVGVKFVIRLSDSPADRSLARSDEEIEKARADVVRAASEHGWHVRSGPEAERRYPDDLAMRFAVAQECELAVQGERPRRFTAETWSVARRNMGSSVSGTVRQHYVVMDLARPLPRFAVAKGGLVSTMNLPDDLVQRDGRRIDGARVWGDDLGLAEWLRPVIPEVVTSEVWVIVTGDRLVLTREGEPDAAGLLQRVALADRVAASLESARRTA